MKFYWHLGLLIKIICGRFRIIRLFTFFHMCFRDIWNICFETYRNNRICEKVAYFSRKIQVFWVNNSRCEKVAYFSRKIQVFWVNNSRILRIKNPKLSGYSFHMNPNIQWNFQICIIVPLNFSGKAKYNEEMSNNESLWREHLRKISYAKCLFSYSFSFWPTIFFFFTQYLERLWKKTHRSSKVTIKSNCNLQMAQAVNSKNRTTKTKRKLKLDKG